MPPTEFAAVMRLAEHVSVKQRQSIADIGDPIDFVYFPATAMCSLVTALSDGAVVEAQTVGREGFVGLPLFHGVVTHRSVSMWQIAGEVEQIPAAAFKAVLNDTPELRQILHRYSQYRQDVLSQSTACSSSHRLEPRCARWLLTTADAIGSESYRLTQEFLSQMLAVRRAGVSVAVGALERQGFIAHRYGQITIADRAGMEQASCECYARLRTSAHELLT